MITPQLENRLYIIDDVITRSTYYYIYKYTLIKQLNSPKTRSIYVPFVYSNLELRIITR